MAVNIRFKGIVNTLANIAADRFQGRLAWATNIARMIWYYDGTNYGVMARNDVLETFSQGIKDSTLTDGDPVVAGASGRLQTQTAEDFRATIGSDNDLTRYGGVGDNSTDNTAALASSVADGQVIVPPGEFRLSAEIPTNTRGVPVTGPGSLMVPVDQSALSKGYHRYPFVEDEGKPWFGVEYLYPLHKAWKDSAVASPTIYLSGDSTIAGAYIVEGLYLPQNALLTGIRQRGFEATVSNQAVSGASILDFDSQMSNAEIDAATAILISFGINDTFPPPASWTTVVSGVPQTSTPVHASLDAWISAYTAALQRIRGRRSELECAIIIKTSNAVSDTQHNRDETQAYAQRRALRKLARDYKCMLIDTPMFISDVRPNQNIDQSGTVGPTGKWSGITPVAPGWMDDPFRTDATYRDANSYWNAVHPLEIGNLWIWDMIAEVIAGPARMVAHNNWTNNALTQALHSWAPSVYGIGATTYRAYNGDGWPLDGFVHTIMDVTGNGIQYHYNYGGSAPKFQVRVKGSGDTWSNWTVTLSESVTREMIIQPLPITNSAPGVVTVGPSGSMRSFGFDGNTQVEELFYHVDLQHDYVAGTDIILHAHWMPSTNAAGNVVFKFDWQWVESGGTIGAPTTSSCPAVAAGGTAWVENRSQVTVSGAGHTYSSRLLLRLYRDPNDAGDTYGADAVLSSVGVHYTANPMQIG